jgi:sodium/proline symporter
MMLGLLASVMHGQAQVLLEDREMVLPFMVLEYTPGFFGGILLAGAIAAMMSTADSQLVVASSAVAEDFYRKVLRKRKEFTEKAKLRISRITQPSCSEFLVWHWLRLQKNMFIPLSDGVGPDWQDVLPR